MQDLILKSVFLNYTFFLTFMITVTGVMNVASTWNKSVMIKSTMKGISNNGEEGIKEEFISQTMSLFLFRCTYEAM